jgi:NADH:ubiquinone oxidoreductase subunit K
MLFLGAALFTIGLMVIVMKKNVIMMLLGVELMLNASNLNLITFNQLHPERLDGQMFALFVIIVAVCETAIGLALVLRVYQHYHTAIPEDINQLKG